MTIATVTEPAVTDPTVTESIAEVRSLKGQPRRVETPAERVVEDSVVGNESISAIGWAPIPSIPVPQGRGIAAHAPITPSHIDIGLCEIRGSQARPPVKIIRAFILVEAP